MFHVTGSAAEGRMPRFRKNKTGRLTTHEVGVMAKSVVGIRDEVQVVQGEEGVTYPSVR